MHTQRRLPLTSGQAKSREAVLMRLLWKVTCLILKTLSETSPFFTAPRPTPEIAPPVHEGLLRQKIFARSRTFRGSECARIRHRTSLPFRLVGISSRNYLQPSGASVGLFPRMRRHARPQDLGSLLFQIKSIETHDLTPSRSKVMHELLSSVGARIHF